MRLSGNTARTLGLAILLICATVALGAEPPVPKPVATVDLTEWVRNQADSTFTTVTFSSETTVRVVACTSVCRDANCSSAAFRWENGLLNPTPDAAKLDEGKAKSRVSEGSRQLIHLNDRKVSRPQHVFDDMRAVWTVGMIYPEEVNREIVRVVDTATRKTCFEWRQTFPMTGLRRRSAAISPDGQLVAIEEGNSLAIYEIPLVCGGPKVSRRRW